jgi:hypothetical protein
MERDLRDGALILALNGEVGSQQHRSNRPFDFDL